MIVVTRHEIYDEQKRAIAFLMGSTGDAKHAEIKGFIEAVVQAELDGAVVDYREAFPTIPTVKNTGAEIGIVKTGEKAVNGDKTRPFYSIAMVHKGPRAGTYAVQINKGGSYKTIYAKFADINLKGGENEQV